MHFISPVEGATSGLVESVVEAAGQVEVRDLEESFTSDGGPVLLEDCQSFGAPGCRCVGAEYPGEGDISVAAVLVSASGEAAAGSSGARPATFPASLGSRCKAWDNASHPLCQAGRGGAWCNKKWCFVDPGSCNVSTAPRATTYLPEASFRGRQLHYSFATCGEAEEAASNWLAVSPALPAALVAAKRSWASELSGEAGREGSAVGLSQLQRTDAQGNESAIGLEPTGRKATQPEHGSNKSAREALEASNTNNTCECIGLSHLAGAIQVSIKGQHVEYPADAGASCKAWDAGRHPLCQGLGTDPFWCKQQWCYVDPCTCSKGYDEPIPSEITYIPGATFQGKSIFYSYHACAETDTYTAVENKQACANKKSHYQCGTLAGCAWRPDLGGCVGGDLVTSCGLSATQTAAVTKAAAERKVAADTIFLLEGRSGALQASRPALPPLVVGSAAAFVASTFVAHAR
jgi:hypothetical protein